MVSGEKFPLRKPSWKGVVDFYISFQANNSFSVYSFLGNIFVLFLTTGCSSRCFWCSFCIVNITFYYLFLLAYITIVVLVIIQIKYIYIQDLMFIRTYQKKELN